ncbi:MAG: transcriptional repressor [Firmicutes bacterium]|nr:transcriptional repressor [Bacillota bacterium]
MKNIEQVLRSKKIKVTPQRMAVYSVLKNSTNHPNVDMIYKKLKPEYPAMSLATIYKTVEVLKQVGLIQELNTGEGSIRYDANTSNHPHIACIECGRVDDIHDVNIPPCGGELKTEIEEKTGYTVQKQQLYFFGICPDCHK